MRLLCATEVKIIQWTSKELVSDNYVFAERLCFLLECVVRVSGFVWDSGRGKQIDAFFEHSGVYVCLIRVQTHTDLCKMALKCYSSLARLISVHWGIYMSRIT